VRPVNYLTHLLLTSLTVLFFVGLTAAQSASSHSPEVREHLHKAAEYLKAKDPNAAVTEFNAVLALDPKNSEAYANLGVIAFFQGDYQRASQNLRKALAINPTLLKTQALLGSVNEDWGIRPLELP